MKKTLKTNGGFSLVEIMVVTVLFSIVSIITTQSVIVTLRSARKTDAASDVRANLDTAVSTIERQLYNAREILTCNGGSRIDYKDVDNEPAAIYCEITNTYGHVIIESQEITSGAASKITGTNIRVTSCSFTCSRLSLDVPPLIEYSITAESTSPDPLLRSPLTLSGQLYLRVY